MTALRAVDPRARIGAVAVVSVLTALLMLLDQYRALAATPPLALASDAVLTAQVVERNPNATFRHDVALTAPASVAVCSACDAGGPAVPLGSFRTGQTLVFLFTVHDTEGGVTTYRSDTGDAVTATSLPDGWRLSLEDGGGEPADLVIDVRRSTPQPQPRPAQDFHGGTSIDVRGVPRPINPPYGDRCTSGFNVVKGDRAYALTARHCLQPDNLSQPFPFVDVSPPDVTDRGRAYSTSVNCQGFVADCLVPRSSTKPDDMMAWQPNLTFRPTARTMTRAGLLPVVGTQPVRQGMVLCHFGRTTGEQCGAVVGRAPDIGGWQVVGKADKGDSGGPAYTYVLSRGRPVGVTAVGITVGKNEIAQPGLFGRFRAPLPGFGVISIDAVEATLGVRTLTQALQP